MVMMWWVRFVKVKRAPRVEFVQSRVGAKEKQGVASTRKILLLPFKMRTRGDECGN
jgi:hypothetical protein